MAHTIHIRTIDGTDSGWKGAFGDVVPVTVHEVLDSHGVIVAAFWNNAPTPGNRTPSACALNECRFRNGRGVVVQEVMR